MRNDVINMSRVRNKEKIWVPDRNWTHDLPYPSRVIQSLSYEWLVASWAIYSVHVWHASCAYPASRGYIFAVWAGVRKVASADNRSIFYRACAKFVTRFASNWFVKSAWVSRESNLRKLANYCPRAFVLFFCFAPSGLKYFSRKISTDRLF